MIEGEPPVVLDLHEKAPRSQAKAIVACISTPNLTSPRRFIGGMTAAGMIWIGSSYPVGEVKNLMN